MNVKQAGSGAEVDERLTALVTNSNAVRAVTAAVEGTIGPKGLDTMLVDRAGGVIITNDGVTILDKMDVKHPAAKMLINIAKAQQEEVGDGTTTATLIAGALVAEGVNQVLRGVPVARIIEGIRFGVQAAVEQLAQRSLPIEDLDQPILHNIAMVAGREYEDIARLVVQAARLIGSAKLRDKHFKLSEIITAKVGADNEVFMGVVIDKERMNKEMPQALDNAKILIVDDALEPENIGDEALGTEAGFRRYLDLQNEFRANILKIVEQNINVVLVDRGVHADAEEILTDAGVLVVQRIAEKELRRVADHTGAKMIKRTGLKKEVGELVKYLGYADRVYEDEKLEQLRVIGGQGKPMATILVGASTQEVVGERERIAKDAASSVQAAATGGYVPGGGAMEVAVARAVEQARTRVKGMAVYGVDCVVNALKHPLAQIVENAGYNPLEKVEEVVAAQAEKGQDFLAVDCETGLIADMLALGVVDPVPVKTHAVKAAGEVAVAILRIDTIIKKREDNASSKDQEPSDF